MNDAPDVTPFAADFDVPRWFAAPARLRRQQYPGLSDLTVYDTGQDPWTLRSVWTSEQAFRQQQTSFADALGLDEPMRAGSLRPIEFDRAWWRSFAWWKAIGVSLAAVVLFVLSLETRVAELILPVKAELELDAADRALPVAAERSALVPFALVHDGARRDRRVAVERVTVDRSCTGEGSSDIAEPLVPATLWDPGERAVGQVRRPPSAFRSPGFVERAPRLSVHACVRTCRFGWWCTTELTASRPIEHWPDATDERAFDYAPRPGSCRTGTTCLYTATVSIARAVESTVIRLLLPTTPPLRATVYGVPAGTRILPIDDGPSSTRVISLETSAVPSFTRFQFTLRLEARESLDKAAWRTVRRELHTTMRRPPP